MIIWEDGRKCQRKISSSHHPRRSSWGWRHCQRAGGYDEANPTDDPLIGATEYVAKNAYAYRPALERKIPSMKGLEERTQDLNDLRRYHTLKQELITYRKINISGDNNFNSIRNKNISF